MLGLVAGTTTIIVIFAFVFNELSYDRFHANYNRIFRLTLAVKADNGESKYALNEGIWDTMLKGVKNISHSTAFGDVQSDLIFSFGGNSFSENNGYFSDEEFFSVFDFQLLAGNRNTILKEPNSIVITKSLAKKIFNTTDALGHTLFWNDGNVELVVTGVIDDLPINSHLKFDFLISINSVAGFADRFKMKRRNYSNTFYLYFKTDRELPIADVQSTIDQAFQAIRDGDAERGYKYETPVQALQDIYFNAHNQFEPTPGGNFNYVKILIGIGIALLFITIFNFINISTSYSLSRIREVGIRKALGTTRYVLIFQFLVETLSITIITTMVSYILAFLMIQQLSTSLFPLELTLLTRVEAIVVLVAYAILLAFLAGLYPAVKIAAMKVTEALKGRTTLGRESMLSPRNGLVLLQLIISMTLISFLFLVSRQLVYLNQRLLGDEREKMIYFVQPNTVDEGQWSGFKEALLDQASVVKLGSSQYTIVETELGQMNTTQVWPKSDNKNHVTAAWNFVGYDFIETMGIKMKEGRPFSKHFPSDTSAIIINDAARKALGLKNALGTTLSWWRGQFEIIGVTDDFHFKSFNNKISPLILVLEKSTSPVLTIRSANLSSTIEEANASWRRLQLGAPFSVNYFDESVKQMLKKEDQLNSLMAGFTTITLIILSIGIVGLVGHITSRRQKEIVIRKMFGASIPSIILLINKRFVGLFILSLTLSVVIFNETSHYWLSTFEYKVGQSILDFALGGCIVVFLGVVAILSHSLKSALLDPAKTLRE